METTVDALTLTFWTLFHDIIANNIDIGSDVSTHGLKAEQVLHST